MLSVLIAALVIAADQITKLVCESNLGSVSDKSVDIIHNILRLTYVRNEGAAFGIFSNQRWIFMVLSAVIIVIVSFAIYRFRGKSHLLDITFGLILGGGGGNMIDRVRLVYVIDFIDFCAFDFWKWVFNVADAAITVGCILFVVYLLFFDKIFVENHKENGDGNE